VAVAMEGFNGCARPLDTMVRRRGYRLYNINNLKLARFKEIFPGAAKSDRIDARKGLELFQLSDHLPLAKGRKYASLIEDWQKHAHFSEEVKWVTEMIQEDARRVLSSTRR
jgi:hypothetical protein